MQKEDRIVQCHYCATLTEALQSVATNSFHLPCSGSADKSLCSYSMFQILNLQAPAVQTADNSIQWVNRYPTDKSLYMYSNQYILSFYLFIYISKLIPMCKCMKDTKLNPVQLYHNQYNVHRIPVIW